MILGVAEIQVVANTAGFKDSLKEQTDPAFGGLKSDAETAGEDAGASLRQGVKDGSEGLEQDMGNLGSAAGVNMREGVKQEAGGIENDLSDIGTAGGVNLRQGVKDGTKGLESDLATVGSTGGMNLRQGVSEETGKMADDVGKDATKAGDELHSGIGSGLSKLANLISNTGLPLGNLSSGLEKAGGAADNAEEHVSGMSGALGGMGGPLAAVGAALAVVVLGAADLGEKMQSSEATIAGAAGTSVSAAQKIGSAFEGTAFHSESSAIAMAAAFATVAGQLKATEGGALNSSQALQVMNASADLAAAKQIDLGTATQTVAGVMQAFQLKTGDAAHVADVLYTASNATGQGIDTLGASLEKVRSKLGETAGSVGQLGGLLVDMTDQGITGRAAMAALNTAMNTLQKTATGVQTAVSNQNAAYSQMSPSLQKLANQYRAGTITAADFTKATTALPPAQAALATAFATASTAVQTAELKFKEMGVTAFNAKGQFVGLAQIIDELHPKFERMTQQQQLAAAATLFGAGAARQMTEIIDAGPAAYDKASAAVNKLGSAHDAAAKQAGTLHGEEKTLVAGLEDLGAKLGAVVIPALTFLVDALLKVAIAIGDVAKFVEQHWKLVVGILTAPIALPLSLFLIFEHTVTSVFQTIIGVVEQVWGTLTSVTSTVVSDVVGFFASLPGHILGFLHEILAGLESAWSSVEHLTETLVSDVVTFFSSLPGKILAFLDQLVSHFASTWSKILAAAGALISSIVAFFAALPGKLLSFLGQIVTNFAATFSKILSAVIASFIANVVQFFAALPGKILGVIESLVSDIAGVFSKILSAAGTLISNIVTFFEGLPGKILSAVGSLVSDFVTLGENWATGIAEGIAKAAFKPVQAIESLASSVLSAVQSKTGTHSPSTVFAELGGNLVEGLRMGIESRLGRARDAGRDLAKAASDGASSYTPTTFAETLLKELHITPTEANVQGVIGWETAEGGNWQNSAKYNPLNTTEGAAGASSINSVGVKAYTSWGEGLKATITTLLNGHYGGILAALKSGSPAAIGNAIDSSVWGTTGAAGTIASTPRPDLSGLKTKAAHTATIPAAVTAMLAAANALIGTHYSNASGPGTSHGSSFEPIDALKKIGVDCSGFVSAVLHAGGVGSVPTTTQGLSSIPGISPGKGLVTVYDRNTGPVGNEHEFIDIAGKYYMSGGNPSVNPSSKVTSLSAAQAQQELAGGGFTPYHVTSLGTNTSLPAGAVPAGSVSTPSASAVKTAKDEKSGDTVLKDLLVGIHKGTMASLKTAVTDAHKAGLTKIEKALDSDHSAALSALSKELVAVHKTAMMDLEKQLVAQAQAAAAAAALAAATTAVGAAGTLLTDTTKSQTDAIADSTKVYLDKQAAIGLTGAALITANAQTSLDAITEANDQAIDAAQTKVDTDTAAGASALTIAEDNYALARANASAAVTEATAQSTLDKATAAASATTSSSSSSANTAINLNIYGNGAMTTGQLFSEIGYAIRSGALPIAAPTPAPAAA